MCFVTLALKMLYIIVNIFHNRGVCRNVIASLSHE